MNYQDQEEPTQSRKLNTMYEVDLKGLTVKIGDMDIDISTILSNGRSSYLIFETLVAKFTGLKPGTQGGTSDLTDENGNGYEVKAYIDEDNVNARRSNVDYFHTAASSTHSGNNLNGPILSLLNADKYDDAFAICNETGYAKNKYYIYTNTREYTTDIPFRFFIVTKNSVIQNLSDKDPRLVSRKGLLNKVKKTVKISGSKN